MSTHASRRAGRPEACVHSVCALHDGEGSCRIPGGVRAEQLRLLFGPDSAPDGVPGPDACPVIRVTTRALAGARTRALARHSPEEALADMFLVVDKSAKFRQELGQWSDTKSYVAV